MVGGRVPGESAAGLRGGPAGPVHLLLAQQGEEPDAIAPSAARARRGEAAVWLSTLARVASTGGVEGEHLFSEDIKSGQMSVQYDNVQRAAEGAGDRLQGHSIYTPRTLPWLPELPPVKFDFSHPR